MLPTVSVFTPFVILLGWVGSIVAGHTKRMSITVFLFFISTFQRNMCVNSGITTNAIILSAYAIGNAAGSFMWKKQYQPRYATFLILLP